jgi:23S rRNA (uracil1939-C5)-methyltransferase
MQKNDLFELTITDIGVDGEGIGHYDGMTFFVKDAVIGDVIRARALKLKKNYGYARVEEVLTPSTFRIVPRCPAYRSCGGCQLQPLSYEKQLDYKQKKVRGNLIRIGGFPEQKVDAWMLPIVGMDEPFRYRNKAQFPVGYDKNGEVVFGFYASRSHNIIPVGDCCLGVEQNKEILGVIKAWMQQYGIRPYDEKTGKGLLRHALLRYGFQTGEIMVCLVINGMKLPHAAELAAALTQIPGMTSISYNVNRDNTNVILGEQTFCVWGQPYITDYIRQFSFQISPQSFYQVNPAQTEKLYGIALDFAGLTGTESVWDLYCGIGTISLFLSQKAKQVYGVEIVPQAIADAKDNAKRNGVTNVEFFVGKAEEVLPEFYERESRKAGGNASCAASDARGGVTDERARDDVGSTGASSGRADACLSAGNNTGKPAGDAAPSMLRPDVIVVDPPRKGCDEKCLDVMLKMQPERIVYVSCDSATLARDLKVLCDGGYEIKKVQAVDQFGQTVHVEVATCLQRVKS